MSKLTRIGVFYDGNYFTHVSNYYNYVHSRKSRLSIGGLHEFFKGRIALAEDSDFELCKIVDSHFFKGRLTASEANEKGNQLYFDRVFEDVLAYEGVTSHYSPIRGNVNTRSADKGLNLMLALEAYEIALQKNLDILVLIGADGDYTPLVKKLHTLGTRVVLASWDFEFTNDEGKTLTTRTAQDLVKESAYPLAMHDLIEEGIEDNDSVVQNIFVLPPVEERETPKKTEARTYESTSVENSAAQPGESHEGNILTLKTGYGFIEFQPNNLFFHHSNLSNVDFNDLFEGDRVRFTVEENEKGELVAKGVELME
ncbi:MAG: NYN domain-containing protein [Oceanospirillaceae bacterium]|nr:NYN domain-containing protein [Oceanospirillaceae bacterium]